MHTARVTASEPTATCSCDHDLDDLVGLRRGESDEVVM